MALLHTPLRAIQLFNTLFFTLTAQIKYVFNKEVMQAFEEMNQILKEGRK